jgi:RHS repeat-associated protein
LGDVYEGKLQNNYLYQGAYAELDEDIGWTDFALRNYDAQIGRWVQQDPYDEFPSPYTGMGNDPINYGDESGGSVSTPPDWIYNSVRDQYIWFDDINSLEQFTNSALDKSIWAYDEGKAKGGFVHDFAGLPHAYLDGGFIHGAQILENVIAPSTKKASGQLTVTNNEAKSTFWDDVGTAWNNMTPFKNLNVYVAVQGKFIYQEPGAPHKVVLPFGVETSYTAGGPGVQTSSISPLTHTYYSYGIQGMLEGRVMPGKANYINGEYMPWRGLMTVYAEGPAKVQLEISGVDHNPKSIRFGIRGVMEHTIFESRSATIPSVSIEASGGIRGEVNTNSPVWLKPYSLRWIRLPF